MSRTERRVSETLKSLHTDIKAFFRHFDIKKTEITNIILNLNVGVRVI